MMAAWIWVSLKAEAWGKKKISEHEVQRRKLEASAGEEQ